LTAPSAGHKLAALKLIGQITLIPERREAKIIAELLETLMNWNRLNLRLNHCLLLGICFREELDAFKLSFGLV
jgi:hypothetical protein